MKRVITIATLLLLCVLQGSAQGNVSMTYSSNIERMMDKFISENKSAESIKGWRIQIITTDDRRKMEAAISKFSSLYTDMEVKWNHVPPYYRVRVGAYENKMQLMAFLLDLKRDFPAVIPVVDDIKKTELVGYSRY